MPLNRCPRPPCPPRDCCFRVDSMLAAKHLAGMCACRASNLVPLYATALDHLQRLQLRHAAGLVDVENVYRDFNASADGLANYAVDNHVAQLDGIVLQDNWATQYSGLVACLLCMSVLRQLCSRLGFVDWGRRVLRWQCMRPWGGVGGHIKTSRNREGIVVPWWWRATP